MLFKFFYGRTTLQRVFYFAGFAVYIALGRQKYQHVTPTPIIKRRCQLFYSKSTPTQSPGTWLARGPVKLNIVVSLQAPLYRSYYLTMFTSRESGRSTT